MPRTSLMTGIFFSVGKALENDVELGLLFLGFCGFAATTGARSRYCHRGGGSYPELLFHRLYELGHLENGHVRDSIQDFFFRRCCHITFSFVCVVTGDSMQHTVKTNARSAEARPSELPLRSGGYESFTRTVSAARLPIRAESVTNHLCINNAGKTADRLGSRPFVRSLLYIYAHIRHRRTNADGV